MTQIKTCSCGLGYDPAAWKCLPYVGRKAHGGSLIEMRSCPCGSTIAVELDARIESAREAAERKFQELASNALRMPSASAFAGLFLHQADGDVEGALALCPTEPSLLWTAARDVLRLIVTEESSVRPLTLLAGGQR